MALVTLAKTNAQGFTEAEQAELDAAEQEQGAIDPPETEEVETEEQPEPAPQAKADAPPAPQQQQTEKGKPPPGYVAIGALEEERNWRKQLTAEKSRMEQTFQQLVQRIQQPQQQQPNGQSQPGQIPDYNTDPIGNLHAQLQTTLQELNSLKGMTQQTRAEQEAYAQMQHQMATYDRHTQEFAAKTPDYGDAAKFLRDTREKALARFMSPDEVKQRIEYEEGLLAGRAMMQGRNPAELFYEVAKDWGYKPKGSEPVENKLDRLQKGQKASASLSAVKGAGAAPGSDAQMSLETLSELYKTDPEAADRMWIKMAKAGRL